MTKTIIWHNPRCTKSRQTLALLQEQNIEPKIVNYLETPPSMTAIKKTLALLKISARELMRKNEAEYKQLGLDNPKLSEAQLIKAMAENPKLIERPVVLAKNKAAIGRPPENVLKIFPKKR